MPEESNTNRIERDNPILAYIVKRIELAIVTGIMSATMAGCHYLDSHHEQRDVQEVWQHSGIWTSNIIELEKHELKK